MKEIQLTQGRVALVDDDDFERMSSSNWCFHPSGYACRSGGRGKIIMMHREILGDKYCENNLEIDHINRDGLDNRKKTSDFVLIL